MQFSKIHNLSTAVKMAAPLKKKKKPKKQNLALSFVHCFCAKDHNGYSLKFS